jgi:hypothetical protein
MIFPLHQWNLQKGPFLESGSSMISKPTAIQSQKGDRTKKKLGHKKLIAVFLNITLEAIT